MYSFFIIILLLTEAFIVSIFIYINIFKENTDINKKTKNVHSDFTIFIYMNIFKENTDINKKTKNVNSEFF
ncbi:hypothetical protein EBU95_16455 [bacterium]|nr:hypothetical protein [bacterium]